VWGLRTTRLASFLVALLSVAGFVVITRAVSDERRSSAHRRAEVQALVVQGQLERAHAVVTRGGQESPLVVRLFAKRLMGLEPTTVCMTIST
jgi:hypothetical protein